MFITLTTTDGKELIVRASRIESVRSAVHGSHMRLLNDNYADVTQSPSEVLAMIREQEKKNPLATAT